nr:MAG TPA: hypothetical protein [Caudoviricetes sp.]
MYKVLIFKRLQLCIILGKRETQNVRLALFNVILLHII